MQSTLYFNTIAKDWNHIRQHYFDDSLKHLISSNYNLTDAVVADIGAGTGFLSLELAKKSALVFGIDASRNMLAELHHSVLKNGLKHVHPIIGTFEAIPLFDCSMDFVFTNMALHHVEAPWDAIQEMYRILKPGGSLHISDVSAHDGDWAYEEMFDLWLGFEPVELHRWLTEAGFQEVDVKGSGLICQGVSSSGIHTSTEILFATARKPNT